jgi:hypothetical protein
METIENLFTQAGPITAILILLCYDVFYLQRKLIAVIEKNTEALKSMQILCSQHYQGGIK